MLSSARVVALCLGLPVCRARLQCCFHPGMGSDQLRFKEPLPEAISLPWEMPTAWGDCQGGREGCLPFYSPSSTRRPRIAAEHLQALPHPSSACSSHPKAASRGWSCSGDHPKRHFLLMSLVNTPPTRQRSFQGQAKGTEQAWKGLRLKVLQGCPSPTGRPARWQGRRGRWLCQEMALFNP